MENNLDITNFTSPSVVLRYIEVTLCKENNLKLCDSLSNF